MFYKAIHIFCFIRCLAPSSLLSYNRIQVLKNRKKRSDNMTFHDIIIGKVTTLNTVHALSLQTIRVHLPMDGMVKSQKPKNNHNETKGLHYELIRYRFMVHTSLI